MDYEKEHMKRIIAMEPAVNQLFHEFIWQVAPNLARLRYNGQGVWSRNPVIEKQVNAALREFAAKYKNQLKQYMTASWEFSERKNDSILMKLVKATGVAVGAKKLLRLFSRVRNGKASVDITNILTLPRRQASRDALLKNRLEQVISPRVWKLTTQNKTLILKCVESGILEGKSATSIASELKKFLNNPNNLFRRVRDPKTGNLKASRPMAAYHPGQGVYRSSYQNALRLARNEVNMAYRRADLERWQNDPTVLGYDVKLSGSHVVEDMCNELAGRYPKSFVWVTWHPSCWCYAVPILPSVDQFAEHLRTDIPIAGHLNDIPGNTLDYVNRKTEKLIKMKNKPYWFEDNFKIDGQKKKPQFINN